jgi:hypothetical protein
MKITLDRYKLAELIEKDCEFTREAALALADYYEEIGNEDEEYDCGKMRCAWSEYASLDAYVQEMYPDNYSEWAEKDEDEQLEWVQNNHQVIEVSDASVLIGV